MDTDAICAITQLRARYSWAYDDADIEALMALFAPDATVDLGAWGSWRTTDHLRRGYSAQIQAHTTVHSIDSMCVEVRGDQAEGKMYVTVFQRPEPLSHPIRFVGRYFDTYRRIDGEWLIESIRLEQFWYDKDDA